MAHERAAGLEGQVIRTQGYGSMCWSWPNLPDPRPRHPPEFRGRSRWEPGSWGL